MDTEFAGFACRSSIAALWAQPHLLNAVKAYPCAAVERYRCPCFSRS